MLQLDFNMSADLMFDSDSSLSPASAEVRDLMEFGVRPRLLDYLSDGESTDWTNEETDTEGKLSKVYYFRLTFIIFIEVFYLLYDSFIIFSMVYCKQSLSNISYHH